MLKKTITYTDFFGEEVTETLYFNITKAELTRMMMEEMDFGEDAESNKNGLAERLMRVGRSGKGKEIIAMFDWLIKKSYGVRSEDGRRFIKNDEVYQEFVQSAAYDAFWTDLIESTSSMEEFVTGIMPEGLIGAAKSDPEYKSLVEDLERRSGVGHTQPPSGRRAL